MNPRALSTFLEDIGCPVLFVVLALLFVRALPPLMWEILHG